MSSSSDNGGDGDGGHESIGPVFEREIWNQVLCYLLTNTYPDTKSTVAQKKNWRARCKNYMISNMGNGNVKLYFMQKKNSGNDFFFSYLLSFVFCRKSFVSSLLTRQTL